MRALRLSGLAGLAVVLTLVAAGCGSNASTTANGNPGPAAGFTCTQK